MPKGSSKEQLTKNKKPKAIKGFGITVQLPATTKTPKKTGPVDGPKPKKKKKGIADLLKGKGSQAVPAKPYDTFKKKKKQKLTEEQKKNVEKGATVMEKEDIPGTPHFRMVPKKSGSGTTIMEAKKGGSVKKFPDLSGDGKVTQKDILMGRGVIKAAKGGLAGRLAKRGYGKARK